MHAQKSLDTVARILADVPSLLTRLSAQKEEGDAVLSLPEKYQRLAAIVEEIAETLILTGQWDRAIHLLRSVLEMADQAEDKGKSGARIRILLGNLLWKRGIHEEALELVQEAKRLAEKALDDRTLGDALYHLGEVYYFESFYMHKRDHTEALEYHNQALALRKKTDDKPGIVHSLSRLGTIYEQTERQEQALECHNEAIRVASEIGYDQGLYRPVTHLAASHCRQDEFEAALSHFWKALEINQRTGDQENRVFALANVGIALSRLDQNHVDVALQLYTQALAIAESLDYKLGICRTLLLLGERSLECGEKGKAKEQFQKAAELAAITDFERFRLAAEKSIAEH
jgi:tetratricopeptide (TPR) repeat protein